MESAEVKRAGHRAVNKAVECISEPDGKLSGTRVLMVGSFLTLFLLGLSAVPFIYMGEVEWAQFHGLFNDLRNLVFGSFLAYAANVGSKNLGNKGKNE